MTPSTLAERSVNGRAFVVERRQARRRARHFARKSAKPRQQFAALSRDEAAHRIQRAFISHREAVLFQLICAELRRVQLIDGAAVLAKVNPTEARMLADPTLESHVVLRLGGASFPPQVYYRVYTSSAGRHQLDGRLLELSPAALRDVRKQMGVRRFADVHDGRSQHFATTLPDRWHRLSGADDVLAGLRLAPEVHGHIDPLMRSGSARTHLTRPGAPPPLLSSWHASELQRPRTASVRRTAQGGTYGCTGQPLSISGQRPHLRFATTAWGGSI